MSTLTCSTSLGLPANGRRSMPMMRQRPSRWRRRARMRPSRPAMPVMAIVLGPSPEDMPAFLEAVVEHRLDRVLHGADVRDELIVVVGIALEPERLAEVEPVLGGERQDREEGGDRAHRKGGRADELRERTDVHRRRLLLGADDGNRHDRRAGLEREAHEPEAEVLELVTARERLGDAAHALGKDEDRLLVLEEAAAVLGRAGDLAPTVEEVAGEG